MRKAIALLLVLTVGLAACSTGLGTFGRRALPTRVAPHPFDAAWEDRSPFAQGLVSEERKALEGMPGATVYHVDLHIAHDVRSVEGRQQVRYVNQEEAPLHEVYLRLFPNGNGGEVTVSEVKVGDEVREPIYEYADTALRVPLAQALQPGDAVILEMQFAVGIPREMGGNYGLFGYFDNVLVLDEVLPTVAVYDDEGWNVEVPPPNGDLTYFDAAFYLVRVTGSARLTIVASGLEVGRAYEGRDQMLTFAAGPARTFYLAASRRYAAVSETVGETVVSSYALAGREEHARLALQHTVNALRAFSSRIGPYPYTELDVLSTPMQALGIEYPGAIGISLRLYEPGQEVSGLPSQVLLEGVVAHEVAHQWFYSAVGNDQVDEPWLDESVVQYVTALYYLDMYGPEGYDGYRGSWMDRWERVDQAEVPIGRSSKDYEEGQYAPIVYGRGPFFLEALAKEMGQQVFDAFLREYYAQHKWGLGTGDGFRQLAEQHCDCDLGPLFREWVYGE